MKAHVWRTSPDPKIKPWCENCGRDKPSDPKAAARKDCRPTKLF